MRLLRYLIPLAIFIGLVALLAVGLRRDPRLVPSPFVGKPAPTLDLPTLNDPAQRITNQMLAGRPTLINIWASWCVACREEHPLLLELSNQQALPIIGFNYKDDREDARQWLQRFGDPYSDVAVDEDGRAGIEWGVYGVPETFLLDAKGTVVYKHVGPLTPAIIEQKILPLARGQAPR